MQNVDIQIIERSLLAKLFVNDTTGVRLEVFGLLRILLRLFPQPSPRNFLFTITTRLAVC